MPCCLRNRQLESRVTQPVRTLRRHKPVRGSPAAGAGLSQPPATASDGSVSSNQPERKPHHHITVRGSGAGLAAWRTGAAVDVMVVQVATAARPK